MVSPVALTLPATPPTGPTWGSFKIEFVARDRLLTSSWAPPKVGSNAALNRFNPSAHATDRAPHRPQTLIDRRP
jgi:hypothetical protein